jgi:hypothetical protein
VAPRGMHGSATSINLTAYRRLVCVVETDLKVVYGSLDYRTNPGKRDLDSSTLNSLQNR